ncbi:hypothetical protein [Amycolatopsis nigrescens]|uniref:hypothetical protein n=1 Tax=Amycolatopsis nigrescens TaxID=381445 RepID=UPI00036E7AFD|nr:hypothetical protein [Amycolatopsis nigrescens]
MAARDWSPRREHLIAASLTGAVVVVVGYASGIGVRTTIPAGAEAEVRAAAPAVPGEPAVPLPAGAPPPVGPVPSLPAASVGVPDVALPMPPMPSMPEVPAIPAPVPPVTEVPSTGPLPPNPSPPGVPPPPGLPMPPVPDCQPGVVQPVLDLAGGLPLVGDLGVTGPSGLLGTLLGYCAPAGPAPAPAPEHPGGHGETTARPAGS